MPDRIVQSPRGRTLIYVDDDPKWNYSQEGFFEWPDNVEIHFSDGEIYTKQGALDEDGEFNEYSCLGTGAIGSPCHQVLVRNNFIESTTKDT